MDSKNSNRDSFVSYRDNSTTTGTAKSGTGTALVIGTTQTTTGTAKSATGTAPLVTGTTHPTTGTAKSATGTAPLVTGTTQPTTRTAKPTLNISANLKLTWKRFCGYLLVRIGSIYEKKRPKISGFCSFNG